MKGRSISLLVSALFAVQPAFAFDLNKLKDAAKQVQGQVEGKADTIPAKPAPDSAPANSAAAIVESVLQIVAIPSSASFTNTDWSQLAIRLPKAKWVNGTDDTSPFFRTTSIKQKDGVLNIKAKGARTMVMQVDADYQSDNSPFSGYLKAANGTAKQICVIDDSASSTEAYYEVTMPGYKPVKVHLEVSAGSDGTTESIEAGDIDSAKGCGSTRLSATPQNVSKPVAMTVKDLNQLRADYPKNATASAKYAGRVYSTSGKASATNKGSDYQLQVETQGKDFATTWCANVVGPVLTGAKVHVAGVLSGRVYESDDTGESFYLKDCQLSK